MRGKYSPTVVAAYREDQYWFTKYCNTPGRYYDPDGFDSYGYDTNNVDRAGNSEHEYYSDDEEGVNYKYNIARADWGFDGVRPVLRVTNVPVASKKKDVCLSEKTDFEQLALSMPKLNFHYITPRLAYLARDSAHSLVVKISKRVKIKINPDGTWEQMK